jgi:hypothetical protein
MAASKRSSDPSRPPKKRRNRPDFTVVTSPSTRRLLFLENRPGESSRGDILKWQLQSARLTRPDHQNNAETSIAKARSFAEEKTKKGVVGKKASPKAKPKPKPKPKKGAQ